jgi:uncharacterized protein YyaL (SSP411 family)
VIRWRGVALFVLLGWVTACDGCRRGPEPSAADAAPKERARTPAEIRQEGNHLVGQTSLYLTQHAHNPVDWYPWSPETLARAKELDRPIFLSMGYASCHWCHVMETEVFESDEVAELLNDRFVSIKVDREERPDVDATYMDALQTMTGSGGWPASLFLTPDLEPFFGGTYFPRARFLEIARNAAKEVQGSRATVAQRGAEIRDRIAAIHGVDAPGDKVRAGEIQKIAERSLGSVDADVGGFRGRTKFPSPSSWTFLLHAARKWGEPFTAPVRRTLDAMASGGLFDQVGGGFFRYTTEPTWTVPHFEKMLYTNASLARLYLEAYATFGEARDLAVARQTLDFLLREMQAPNGKGFYASLDADSGGKEGAFYVFQASELGAILGETEGAFASKLFGATSGGNFEGANVLTLRSPEAARVDPKRLEGLRAKLRAAREQRPRPRRDEKILTAWNGLAIDALSRGFAATGDTRYRDAATSTADYLWEAHRDNGKLVRTSTGGKIGDVGMLDDHASFAAGLVSLYEATGNVDALIRAIDLVSDAQRSYSDPSGSFYASRAGGPLPRRIEPFDSEEPCGLSLMLATLVRLAALTGRPALYEAVERTLGAQASAARRSGLSMASWLDAALLEAGPFYDVVIAGAPDDASTAALANVMRSLSPPWASRAAVDATGPTPVVVDFLPSTVGKIAQGGRATAYVCVRGACKEPSTEPAKLRAQLLAGWTR